MATVIRVVVVSVPILIVMPAMVILVPPFVFLLPASLPRFLQFVLRVLGLLAPITVALYGLVQLVVSTFDTPLTIVIIGVEPRHSGKR